MKNKHVLITIVVAFFLLIAASLSAQDYAVIGLTLPLSGPYSKQGDQELKAYNLAIEEINRQGGLLGKTVVSVVKDTATNPQVAAEGARQLIDENGAVMITGGASSGVALELSKIAKEKKRIFMACITHSNATTGFVINPDTGTAEYQSINRFTFRWYHNAWMSAHALAKYLLTTFGSEAKYFYLVADYTWGHSIENSFRRVLEAAGCKTIDVYRVPLGKMVFIPELMKARNANPDVLILGFYGKDLENSLKQATMLGLKEEMKIVAPVIELYMAKRAGAEAMEGVISTNPWYWTLQQKYQGSKEFVEKYREKYEETPSVPAAAAWVSMHEYANAVRRAGDFEPLQVIKELEGHSFVQLKGEEYWRSWDHQAISSTLILEGKAPDSINGDDDRLEIIDEIPGESISRSWDENPVEWEMSPQ